MRFSRRRLLDENNQVTSSVEKNATEPVVTPVIVHKNIEPLPNDEVLQAEKVISNEVQEAPEPNQVDASKEVTSNKQQADKKKKK